MLTVQKIIHQRYQLQYKLGERPARQTWLARDTETDSLVVVKLLASSNQMQWNDLKLFEREARILKELKHPCIPQYRDYFPIDEDTHWFAIIKDYIPGESLQTLLDRGKYFSESEVKNIAFKLLDILDYLHQHNPPVLHRDIKPSNIILGEDERIYLVDFGSIQDKAAAKGASFTVVGTYGYTPMEQFGGRAVAASDLYALGATLIHLLTRIPPAELLQEDSQIHFQDRVQVTQHLASWLSKMTEATLKERFHSVSEARQALETPSVENNAEQPQFESIAPQENRARQNNYLPQRQLQLADVEQQAQQWQESGKKDDYLLFKTQLSEARIIQQQQPLSPLAQNFIEKSIEHREGEGKRKRIKFWGLSLIILAGTAIGGIIINERLKLRELNAAIEEVKNCGELLETERYPGKRTLANCETEIAIIEDWAKTRSLSGYDLQGAYLVGAELENADFSGADLYAAIVDDANLQGADLSNTNFQDAEFKNANLYSANLSNANLESADFEYANLESANLSHTNLRDARLGETNLKDANLESADLQYISPRSTNFEGANLENAKLTVYLGYIYLKGANLNGTIINVSGAYNINISGKHNSISQIKSTCYWKEAVYKNEWDETNNTLIVDEETNQQLIKQLKQDKASNPETPVDCSKWE